MMIHEKLMSGQFMLDYKNERSSLLSNGGIAHQQQALHQLQPPSPPLAPLDIYSAYAYQQQLQQHLIMNSQLSANNSLNHTSNTAEVLDLSRRDAVDSQRKTPSPNQPISSFDTGSPAASPNSSGQPQLLPVNSLNISTNLAALYSGLYYPAVIKREKTTPPPATTMPISSPQPPSAILENNNPRKNIFTPLRNDVLPEPQSPPRIPHSTVTTTTPTSSISNLASLDAKSTRPFKAFPRDPLVIAASFAANDVLLDNARAERYTEYRKRVLEQIRSSNGGARTVTNPKMRRTNSASGSVHEGSSSNTSENDERHHEESSDCDSNAGNDQQTAENTKSNENMNSNSCSGGVVKDAAYYERRRKNNAAAKKSRDRRRIKEDEIAIRAAYLERQNIELICQIDALKAQVAALTSKMA